jgi:hypothetical protein
MSVANSTVHSPHQSSTYEQDDQPMEREEKEEIIEENSIDPTPKAQNDKQQKYGINTAPNGIKCSYCACITSKSLEQHYKECNLKIRFNYIVCSYGKQWKSVLTGDQFNHISEHTKFKDMFSDFCIGLSREELNEVKQLG